MPKATTTAKQLYQRKQLADGTTYRVRPNKRGVMVVPVSFEIPEHIFLRHESSARAVKRTVQEWMIEVLMANR